MEILYAPKFVRQYKKLPKKLQEAAERRENIFRKNPFDSRLKTHKLSGHLEGFYGFSIDFSCRIIFDFADEGTVRFYEIGTHDIYE
jgi:addiction module RelE/StbE family toxin